MTLDEAIERELQDKKEMLKIAERCDAASGYSRYHDERIRTEEAKKCEKRAEEHHQIAEWLKELKRHREAWEKVKAEIVERTKHLDEHDKEDMRELIGILSILASITEHLQEVTDA